MHGHIYVHTLASTQLSQNLAVGCEIKIDDSFYTMVYVYVMSCHECYIRFIITEPSGRRPQARGRGDYKPDIARVGMT